ASPRFYLSLSSFLCLCVILFSFLASRISRALPSFPTRRSSDLILVFAGQAFGLGRRSFPDAGWLVFPAAGWRPLIPGRRENEPRSEEHTSELQSRFDLVCRLLLEKKKSRALYGPDE